LNKSDTQNREERYVKITFFSVSFSAEAFCLIYFMHTFKPVSGHRNLASVAEDIKETISHLLSPHY